MDSLSINRQADGPSNGIIMQTQRLMDKEMMNKFGVKSFTRRLHGNSSFRGVGRVELVFKE